MSDLRVDEETANKRRSSVFFFDELPRIASCNGCIVLVPVPCFVEKRNSKLKKLFKKKKSEHTLHTVGTCTLMLLEYQSQDDGEMVNFEPSENQKPVIQLDLNRIVNGTLQHVVKQSKVWQEFHLNDNGKRRSFVLQFEKGPEFDEFHKELISVTSLLRQCKDNKSVTNKKYFLVGYKSIDSEIVLEEKDLNTDRRIRISGASFGSDCQLNGRDSQLSGADSQLSGADSQLSGIDSQLKRADSQLSGTESKKSAASSSSSSSYNSSTSKEDFIPPPFSPKAYEGCRVTGLDKFFCSTFEREEPESQESSLTREERYRVQIYGSLAEPATVNSVLNSDDLSLQFSDSNNDCPITGLVHESELIYNDQENGRLEYSLDITEIDKSINITDVRGDSTKAGTNLENFLNLEDTISEKTLKACDFEATLNITEIQGNTEFKKFSQGPKFILETTQSSYVNIDLDAMKARQELNELKQTAQLLQAAINEGDGENARQYADILATSRVKVAVNVDENSLRTDEQNIKIKVCVEDKETTGASLLLSVKLSDTIGDLKKNMFLKHKFPTEVQKWIVGKRIPKDEESLQKLRVTDGQTVILYLVSAKSVGLDKKQHMAASGIYFDMGRKEPVVPVTAGLQPMNDLNPKITVKPEIRERPPRAESQAEIQPLVPLKPEVGGDDQSRSPVQKTSKDSKSVVGWQCKACTYLNLPTRPGCEMCSNPRPKDYKIPESYVMSQIEQERLQKEKEDERKAQQAAAERRARERELDENLYKQMTEEEIHQLLTLNDQMQQQIIQSHQTGGQEHEFHEPVQTPRGPTQQQQTLENIQFTLQPNPPLDFSGENEDSD